MTDIEICQHKMLYAFPTPEHAAENGACPRPTSDQGAARVDRPTRPATSKTQGLITMTTEILGLAVQFQLWVNRLVARRLEAQATKFIR
ncbi:hypothetical protein [Bradyrhizobium sp.]|uniref:hypothetical protein n=1 Tax=Bradyrhizobium sp. TaxID=376 RepID=UPI001DF21985|nr:hypothetical protein [Bradyrhizobium sp.]MBI5323531.1 hypothetical protein [Bradyrhizobium sp.]